MPPNLHLNKILYLMLAALLWSPVLPAAQPHDRNWLIQYVNREIPATARNPRYLALMNAAAADKLLGVDLAWLEQATGEGYRARTQINKLGQLAFYYRTRALKGYGDNEVLETLRRGYLAVAGHITPEGKFAWDGDKDMYWAGSHEHGWRLEPLLIGYLWAGRNFPAADQKVIDDALRRVAEWMVQHPLLQTNNRGAVWCAVTALCGLYYERQDYLALAARHAPAIMNQVVLEDGEIGEHTGQYGGGGPDSNYTYTSLSYVYLYRLLSGSAAMDPRLVQAGRWLALYNTRSGCPLVAGASVRRRYANPAGFQDVFPFFEWLSRQDPFFAKAADGALAKKEKMFRDRAARQSTPQGGGHIIWSPIWAMLAEGAATGEEPLPDWAINHTAVYERPQVHYALVSRQYQTGVVFRGRLDEGYNYPLRGMQTFAWGDEFPILLHTDANNSSTQADGIDTAEMNVARGPQGWEVVQTLGGKAGARRQDLATLADRRQHLWMLYAYTPASAVVITGGARGPILSRWVMNRNFVSRPQLDLERRLVAFEGRQGRIYFLRGEARLLAEDGGELVSDERVKKIPADVLQVTVPAPLSAFAFSEDGFRFEKWDPDRQALIFADTSGRYRVFLGEMLSPDGNLKRDVPMRLTLLGKEDAPAF